MKYKNPDFFKKKFKVLKCLSCLKNDNYVIYHNLKAPSQTPLFLEGLALPGLPCLAVDCLPGGLARLTADGCGISRGDPRDSGRCL